MKTYYTVNWTIEVLAKTSMEAAERALTIQRDPDCTEGVLLVSKKTECPKQFFIKKPRKKAKAA